MIKRTHPWDRTKGNGAVETCERCSMMVIKYREAGNDTPRYAALAGQAGNGHYMCTNSAGVRYQMDPRAVTVIWIKDFAG